ncbi:PucR family transcriptional regulator [Nocardia asteroides]|uniref:PucR family transcriptional regulator n=1 Tax=Nocardia asteroides TaxID=1824 RepID=UPI0034333FAA
MTIQLDRPATARPMRETRTHTGQFVGRRADTTARRTPPGEHAAVSRQCLATVRALLDGDDEAAVLNQLAVAAAGWAHDEIPVDTVLHAIHDGLRQALDRTAVPRDRAGLLDEFRRGVVASDRMCATATKAYIREHREVAGTQHTAVHAVASALLAGSPTGLMARDRGIVVAESYSVLALWIHEHPDGRDARMDATVVARRALRRVQAALAQHCGDQALALLSVDGGTLLIPAQRPPEAELDALVGALARAARADITAALVPARTEEIPAAAQRAHELLDMVERLDWAPGLYRFTDLALEYQLTRPGPGRATLGELLRPLDDHPELYETLRVHIANNMNRQRTARLLHIHTNTVDYRLRRVTQLTGLDPTQGSGLWQLRSAMIARSVDTRPPRTGRPSAQTGSSPSATS